MARTPNADDLQAAVDAGVISADQARGLKDFYAGRGQLSAPGGEEDLRFIRNFHDVFLAVGLGIFFIGALIAIGQTPDQMRLGALAIAIASSWGLGELFSRRRRLFLPSIVIAIAFVGFALGAAGMVLGESGAFSLGVNRPPEGADSTILLFWLTGLGAALLYYARFRLPFAAALIAAFGAISAVLGLAVLQPGALDGRELLILPTTGAITFLFALLFDARDPERQTRLSDVGFWLHLAAAPQIVHGVVFWVFGGNQLETVNSALVMLALVFGLGLVALLINRRALLVSALIYAGAAVAILLQQSQFTGEILAASTLLILGGGVVALGAGWHASRRAVLRLVPRGGLFGRLFPPENQLAD